MPRAKSPLLRSPRRRLRRAVGRAARTPFGRLVAHFLTKLLREGRGDGAEVELGLAPLLGLLAAPGLFQTLMMLDKYSSLLNWVRGQLRSDLVLDSAPDKYLFLSIAMATSGIVTVLKWDRMLPDAQDFLNLRPLPVGRARILLANALAIAVAVFVLSLAVNGVPAMLFPLVVAEAAYPPGSISAGQFLMAHLLSVGSASLFAFVLVFAVLGVTRAVLPRSWFRGVTAWVRGLMAASFVALFALGFAAPTIISAILRSADSPARYLPPVWFLGFYQGLQGHTWPALAKLAALPLPAMLITSLIALLGFAVGYRRSFEHPTEQASKRSNGNLLDRLPGVLDWFAPRRSGFARAGYLFAVRALLRNEAHRTYLAVTIGLAALLALEAAASSDPLAAVMRASYTVVLGLFLSFPVPAMLPANWVFRTLLDKGSHQAAGLIRRVVWPILAASVLIPGGVWMGFRFGAWAGAGAIAFVALLTSVLIDVMLQRFRGLPFAAEAGGFQEDLPVLFVVHAVALFGASSTASRIWTWAMVSPLRSLSVCAVSFALAAAVRRWPIAHGLDLEKDATGPFARLRITDGS